MKISDLDQPRIGDIVEFETDPDTVVEGLIVGETADGYIYEFSDTGYTELNEACTYGKYYCSTDKKYKCRTGPKQSRTTEAANAAQQAAIAIAKKKKAGVAEGEVVPLGKKHRGDLSDTHSCPKCGGDLQGGTYMGHKVKVCMPCKQVYLPPNSGIDQKGNKIDEQSVAEGLEHYDGIEISMEKEADEIMVKAMMSGGRELGHVLFVIDGEYLAPQDLEVDERYQGQGIAATMYDYVKSKGYKIRRSGQQTDAGAGFWDKHKPGKNVWEQSVAEGFDTYRTSTSNTNSFPELRGVNIPGDMKHPDWKEPTWSFQEVAEKLGVSSKELQQLALSLGNFPKKSEGLTSRYGSKAYYPQSEIKRWVNASDIRNIIKAKQGVAEGSEHFNQCYVQACKIYDRAEDKKLNPVLLQVAGYKGDGSNADEKWLALPQRVWQHYVVVVNDTVYDPTAKQFGNDKPTKYSVEKLQQDWDQQYQIRPKQDVDEAHPNSKIYDKCWNGYKKVPGKKRGEKGSCVEESSGYIPRNSKEARDPRWSSALTHDVTTHTMRDQIGKFFPTDAPQDGQQQVTEAEYQGREVPLGRPMRGDVKKFKVYVKDPATGNVKKVNFGDPNMRIKKSNPARRRSFRARHNCKAPGPRTKARYWSCRKW